MHRNKDTVCGRTVKHEKILIIEDDNAIAEIEKDYLTLSGLDATIITDGEKGWKKRKAVLTTSSSWI